MEIVASSAVSTYPSFPFSPGERVEVRVLACTSLDSFVCQVADGEALHTIARAIEEEGYSLSDDRSPITRPFESMLVLGYHTRKDCWYRGLVTDFSELSNTTTVLYVDQGFSENLPTSRVKLLNDKLSKVAPPQSFTCQLPPLLEADLDPVFAGEEGELEWPSRCVEYFKGTVKDKGLFLAEFVKEQDGHYTVQLFMDSGGEGLVSIRDQVIAKLTGSALTPEAMAGLDWEEEEEEWREEEEEKEAKVSCIQSMYNSGCFVHTTIAHIQHTHLPRDV